LKMESNRCNFGKTLFYCSREWDKKEKKLIYIKLSL
jgi:hypothetical protein